MINKSNIGEVTVEERFQNYHKTERRQDTTSGYCAYAHCANRLQYHHGLHIPPLRRPAVQPTTSH